MDEQENTQDPGEEKKIKGKTHTDPSVDEKDSQRIQEQKADNADRSTSFEQKRDVTTDPSAEDTSKEFVDALFFLMEHPDKVRSIIRNLRDNDKVPGDDQHIAKYNYALERALYHHPDENVNATPFYRDNSHWLQGVEHNGELLSVSKPRFSKETGKLSGNAALLRIRAAAGLGTVVNVPLWHTGIWIKLKAPSEGALLELERRIGLEKINLGRSTIGVSFTNVSIYTTYYLLELIFDHLYEVTYHTTDSDALENVIKVTDIPQMVWGIACAIWPNGYRLVRPCVSDPTKCSRIDEKHVNVTKLSWVDNRALSNYQRNHMTHRDGQFSDEQLATYENEHLVQQRKKVKISDEISLRLRVPTIAQYKQAGFAWVDSVVRMADEAFGQSLRGDERNNYIQQQAAMSNLRRYSHWIEAIELDDGESSIEDQNGIDEALNALTGHEQTRSKILNEIETFMRESVISTIGIPRYDCPDCGGEPDPDTISTRQPELIQLEVNQIFFTLQFMNVYKLLQSD